MVFEFFKGAALCRKYHSWGFGLGELIIHWRTIAMERQDTDKRFYQVFLAENHIFLKIWDNKFNTFCADCRMRIMHGCKFLSSLSIMAAVN